MSVILLLPCGVKSGSRRASEQHIRRNPGWSLRNWTTHTLGIKADIKASQQHSRKNEGNSEIHGQLLRSRTEPMKAIPELSMGWPSDPAWQVADNELLLIATQWPKSQWRVSGLTIKHGSSTFIPIPGLGEKTPTENKTSSGVKGSLSPKIREFLETAAVWPGKMDNMNNTQWVFIVTLQFPEKLLPVSTLDLIVLRMINSQPDLPSTLFA